LLVYCNGLRCWHSATVDADFLAGDVVLKSLEPRGVQPLRLDRCGRATELE
jgi:hypothetical protein